ALAEQGQGRVDGLAGDVVARHALAVALGAVLEHAADQDVVGLGAAVRGVPHRPAQRDAYVVGGQLGDSHRGPPRRGRPSPTLYDAPAPPTTRRQPFAWLAGPRCAAPPP